MKHAVLQAISVIVVGFCFASVSVSAADFDVAEKYNKSCAVCHNSGVAGAPKKGDTKAWAARLAKGEATLLKSVKNGMGAMPAKGLCTDCDDAQFKALIKYIAK